MIKKSFKTLLYLAIFLILSQFAYALNVVKLSPEYFPNSSRGSALSSADIYVGKPDLDPEIVANQKTLSVQQEDGTIVEVAQPIHTSAGGVPQYAGSPVTLLVEGDYSLKVLDSNGSQIYYVPSTAYEQYLVAGNYYYPDYAEADQGVVGGGETVTDILAEVGVTENATMYFSHNSGGNTTTYTFTTNTTITDNFHVIVEDGAILDGAGIFTLDNPSQIIASPNQQILGNTITLALTHPGILYPEWKGALGDGSTDDSVAIQAVIDTLEVAKGGTVQFLSKTYICNITIKSYVELKGASPIIYYATATGAARWNSTILKANATGVLVDTTLATNEYNIIIRNIHFQGLGAAIALIGLRLQDTGAGYVGFCTFDNFADQAIHGINCDTTKFESIVAIGSLLDTTRAQKDGVFHLDSNSHDNFVQDCEFTSSQTSLSDANAYCCAVVIESYANFITNVVTEISDIGFHFGTSANVNKVVGCRADLNWSHGYEVTGDQNFFTGSHSYRNSRETDNTYDGFYVSGGKNIFTGCAAHSLGGDAWQHRYGFNDTNVGISDRNIYTGCVSGNHDTAWFNSTGRTGASPHIPDESQIDYIDDATPSVNPYGLPAKMLMFHGYTGATDVTDFDDAVENQIVYLQDSTANGHVTIKNGTNIYTNTGADKILRQRVIYAFKHFAGKWYEISPGGQFNTDTTVAGAGVDGTISSRNANALNECDGFVKLYNSAGTLVNVPYWLDITP